MREDRARGLVDHLLRQRADSRAREAEPATPREFRQDLATLLRCLGEQARTGRLPPYLPLRADVTALSRTVRVRPGIRSGMTGRRDARDPGRHDAGRAYQLPVERPEATEPPLPWPEVAAEHRRLVVLADPGLGKSWLVRTETHRLAQEALTRLGADPAGVIVPIPVRCDQLAAAAGKDLADRAAMHLAGQQFLPARSRAGLAAKVRAGEVVLLLDALDELTAAESGLLRELVRSWADQAGHHARCVITSRIAGYTGSSLPGACEVELQPFTPGDVKAVVAAWHLPPTAVRRLLDRIRDPAIAAMARIPLLLALLCSLTAQLPFGEALPRTRGQLYDRVVRWFLTQAHRSSDNPRAPALDDFDVDALLEILAPLAFTFACRDEGWTDLMSADRLLNAIRAVGPAFTERCRPAVEVLRELSVGAGVLVPDRDPSAGRSPDYLFLHRTVAEYLVARHLATLPQADWLAIVDQHRWFDPDWAEVIPMLGERLSPLSAATLIQHLLADEADPFHCSLLTAIRIWGTRPDADNLLPVGPAAELAEHAGCLIRHNITHDAMTSHLTAMTYLPSVLRTQFLGRLSDDDRWVRCAAVEALVGREGPAVLPALLERLSDHDAGVRRAAVEALAGREGPAVLPALLECLSDHDRWVRRAAVEALAGRGEPAVLPALLECLSDHDAGVRRAAVGAVAGRGERAVLLGLLERLSDHEAGVRRAAVGAVAGREGPAVLPGLLECLSDHDWWVRRAAVGVLAGREGPAVLPALLECLSDHDWWVRRAAVEALAGREGPAVLPALLECLSDYEAGVRFAAVKALADRESPQDLLTLARETRRLDQSSLLQVFDSAEQLMTRDYRRIDLTEQPAVRAAMGWLTVTTLTDSSDPVVLGSKYPIVALTRVLSKQPGDVRRRPGTRA